VRPPAVEEFDYQGEAPHWMRWALARRSIRKPDEIAYYLAYAPLEVVSFGEAAVADEGCGYAYEGEEVFRLALVAAVEPSAVGKPRDGPLDDPSVAAKPLRRLDAAAGDAVSDTAFAEPAAQVVVVVTLVRVELAGAPSTGSSPGPDRRNAPHERFKTEVSCMFAPEMPSESGSPFLSVIKWIFDPDLPRSVGFGPVRGPLL
jgi:hypothetical protein